MSRYGVGRYEGRLFAQDGRLCMVVEANEITGMARISCRVDGEQNVLDMSLGEVTKRIAAGPDLVLDNANGKESSKRILRKDDGWFFSAREGLKGPYPSEEEAGTELSRYIVTAQS